MRGSGEHSFRPKNNRRLICFPPAERRAGKNFGEAIKIVLVLEIKTTQTRKRINKYSATNDNICASKMRYAVVAER